MTKLLTTGQMIDQLKAGDVAERIFEESGVCSDRFTKAKKDIDGELMFFNEQREEWELDRLTSSLIDSKWRILPNYINFDEAMEALKQGRRAAFIKDKTQYTFRPESFEYMFNANWVILDD